MGFTVFLPGREPPAVDALRWLVVLSLACAIPAHSQASGRNPPPPMPWVAQNECPGEGCALGAWAACSTLVTHVEPRADSRTAFTLRPGERMTADYGEVHVTVPGLVIFRDTGTVTQLDERQATPTLRAFYFAPTDTLYVLNYLGEGYLVWWLHGKAETASFFWRSKNFRHPEVAPKPLLVRETTETWWVRVRNSRGETGWVVPSRDNIAGHAPHYGNDVTRCSRAPAP